jgi:hypothetical protein
MPASAHPDSAMQALAWPATALLARPVRAIPASPVPATEYPIAAGVPPLLTVAELMIRTFEKSDGVSLGAFNHSEYHIIFAISFDKMGRLSCK